MYPSSAEGGSGFMRDATETVSLRKRTQFAAWVRSPESHFRRCGADPLVPLFGLSSDSHQADEGVGLQTRGSAPHRIFILNRWPRGHGALPDGRGSVPTGHLEISSHSLRVAALLTNSR